MSPPECGLLIPIHMDLVIERADSGLVFAAFNGDSLREQLRSGTLAAPYVDWNGLLPLTATAPESLNATLRDFAARPGALSLWRRVVHRITRPSLSLSVP